MNDFMNVSMRSRTERNVQLLCSVLEFDIFLFIFLYGGFVQIYVAILKAFYIQKTKYSGSQLLLLSV